MAALVCAAMGRDHQSLHREGSSQMQSITKSPRKSRFSYDVTIAASAESICSVPETGGHTKPASLLER